MSNEDSATTALLSTGPGFPQQGSIDWVAMSKNTVEFTIDALSRISRAGVEALTICAARAIFANVQLDVLGEQRIQEALKSARAFSSFNNTLWFGFGVKDIIRSFSESAQGLACIGVCSCLTEEYSSVISSRIMRELFLLYDPPAELSPSLRQWHALIEACDGAVSSTNFGLILSELSRICLLDGVSNLRSNTNPDGVARALKEIFNISNGTTKNVYISGGVDCAWIAAVAHWLLGLSVAILDGSGNIVYRPGNLKKIAKQDVQVIICYGPEDPPDLLTVTRKSYTLPDGHRLLFKPPELENEILTLGRLDWSTCLCDTFGKPMRTLLTSIAPQTGAYLGSVARIIEHIACDSDTKVLSTQIYDTWHSTAQAIAPVSSGRQFFLKARDLLPELRKAPSLLTTMESMIQESPEVAIREFVESSNSIYAICKCSFCNDRTGRPENSHISERDEPFCFGLLIEVICSLVRLSSLIVFHENLSISPTFAGLERMYHDRRALSIVKNKGTYDPVMDGFLTTWDSKSLLFQIRQLFTGRTEENNGASAIEDVSAIAVDGLCFYLRTLCEISAEPERACSVHIVPGRIEWNGHLYSQVRDTIRGVDYQDINHSSEWLSTGSSLVKNYNLLCDSSTGNLAVDLQIDEALPVTDSIVARWHIIPEVIKHAQLTYATAWIGPQFIARQLAMAWIAKDCHNHSCSSLDGFRTILVEGEGAIRHEQLLSHYAPAAQCPVIRVLPGNPAGVWVALSQVNLLTNDSSKGPPVKIKTLLQGRQCIHCCVKNSILRFQPGDENNPCLRSCILTDNKYIDPSTQVSLVRLSRHI